MMELLELVLVLLDVDELVLVVGLMLLHLL